MRLQDKKQLVVKSIEDLERMIREEQTKLLALRFDFAAGKIKNFSEIWKAKKRVAIASTFIEQKKRAGKTVKATG